MFVSSFGSSVALFLWQNWSICATISSNLSSDLGALTCGGKVEAVFFLFAPNCLAQTDFDLLQQLLFGRNFQPFSLEIGARLSCLHLPCSHFQIDIIIFALFLAVSSRFCPTFWPARNGRSLDSSVSFGAPGYE